MKPLVVFDPEIAAWLDNNIFNPEFAQNYPGAMHWAQLAQLLSYQGIEIETIDRFLSKPAPNDSTAFLIVMATHITENARKVIAESLAYPAICVCLESPLIAYDFYHNLEKYSKWFRHIFAFAGAKSRVTSQNTFFHPIVWPYENRNLMVGRSWSERNYLTLINGNRRAEQNIFPCLKLLNPKNSLKKLLNYLNIQVQLKKDPWFGKEYYLERLKAIHFFSNKPEFHLYGRGWNQQVEGKEKFIREAINKCYCGEIPTPDKLKVLGQYRFAICIENSSFPGYITEKILDCFFSGCIPVYLGAPDIHSFVPKAAFIDLRNFENYQELDTFIKSLSWEQAAEYLYAAQKFITSLSFNPFKGETLAYLLKDILEECFDHSVEKPS